MHHSYRRNQRSIKLKLYTRKHPSKTKVAKAFDHRILVKGSSTKFQVLVLYILAYRPDTTSNSTYNQPVN
ncbi:hypothetical protein CHS0354_004068, partial [Potamilus streckersoni]